MTDEEALKEIDRQEKRFAAAGFGNGLRLAKSAREYCQTMGSGGGFAMVDPSVRWLHGRLQDKIPVFTNR